MRLPVYITKEERDYRNVVKGLDLEGNDKTFAKFGVRTFYHKFKGTLYTEADILNHIHLEINRGRAFMASH